MWRRIEGGGAGAGSLELLLRIGVAGCFIGHGAFGIIGKGEWLPYFAAMGIGETWAWRLMPLVGAVDVLVGVTALLSPRPLLLAYAAAWAAWTALLRPLAGESPFEVLERAGNYGVPLALLLLAGVPAAWSKGWLRPLRIEALTAERRMVARTLRVTVALLLAGHGGLAFAGKPLLAGHVAGVGLPAGALPLMGALEIGLALAVALRPAAGVLLLVLGWKLATEALFPLTGAPIWEFVERAGSYVAPLALWTMVRRPSTGAATARVVSRGAAAAVVVTCGAAALIGATAPASSLRIGAASDTTLLAGLRSGGYVLACRHAITDRSRGDARRVDFDDPSTQRVLSEAGRRQARRLGDALERMGVPVGEVLTSPYARTRDSAELAFGRSERSEALRFGSSPAQRGERRRLLAEPPRGANRVLMTHQGVLYEMLPGVERGSVREGDCVVVRPDGEGSFRTLERLGPEDWEGLRGQPALRGAAPARASAARAAGGAQEAGPAELIDAVRRGGTTLLCRHAITGDFREVEPVDYDDPSTQRRLSAEGERQSRAMGRAMRSLGVSVTELVASPMHRAYRTAELMFDAPVRVEPIWHTNGGSYGGSSLEARARALAEPVEQGTRLIVSHIGTISSVLPEARGRLGEGDCAVMRAGRAGHRLLGFVKWRAWGRAAERSGPRGRAA